MAKTKQNAGYITSRQTPTETWTLYDGKKASMDTFAGRWQTVCETHGTICSHRTLKLAREQLKAGGWCEECMDYDLLIRIAVCNIVLGVSRKPDWILRKAETSEKPADVLSPLNPTYPLAASDQDIIEDQRRQLAEMKESFEMYGHLVEDSLGLPRDSRGGEVEDAISKLTAERDVALKELKRLQAIEMAAKPWKATNDGL